ncbi:MAG: LacI family DNA-binding transcriptional regulator [Verrucomicrobia bacterium]|nr:LacI family DNA-binding transcriptional regulator [Verrucomicrobiota bacterium]
MIRLKDIAVQARVSVMTVSKALRDAKDISAATKARIQKIADELGYMPDVAARSLRSGHTKLFGVVISSLTNPIYARILLALEEHAHELGYEVIFAHSLNLPHREAASIQRLLSRRVDGLFISPVYRLEPKAPAYERIVTQGTPTVILGHRAPFCEQFTAVETDDVAASFEVTRHLLALGHRRIAFFTGRQDAPWSIERLEGYRRALRQANLEVDDKLIFPGGTTIEEGSKAALQLIGEAPQVTAVQAVNDLIAIGAAEVFLKQGQRIPEDISVTGFGNILTSEHFRVPLTTISQPKYRLGEAAMEAMLALLRGEKPQTRRLSAELIVRESTGPAKKA